MAFTSKLGTAASLLAGIELGILPPATAGTCQATARSNLARSGCARSGYAGSGADAWMPVVTINDGSGDVNYTAYILYGSLSVSENLTEPDTAHFTLTPHTPTVPLVRSRVTIAFGTGNVEFGGVVLSVQQRRVPGPQGYCFFDVACIDHTVILDGALVTRDYPSQAISAILIDILAKDGRGVFSSTAIDSALAAQTNAITCLNERPSTAFRRLLDDINGSWYIDPYRRLHAWMGPYESTVWGANPQPLADALETLKQFSRTEDSSQIRNVVTVEGQRTSALLGIPARGGSFPPTTIGVPIADGSMFETPAPTSDFLVRLGSQYFGVTGAITVMDIPSGKNPPGTTLSADVAPGANPIPVNTINVSDWPTKGWIRVGEQLVHYATLTTTAFWVFTDADGYGALQAPAKSGDSVTFVPSLENVYGDELWSVWGVPDRFPISAQAPNADVVVAVQPTDPARASVLAAREQSSGVYEQIVQDGRYSYAGAQARGLSEIAQFGDPLVTYQWDTEDMNARPGRQQAINLSGPWPVVDTVQITVVEITLPVAGRLPRRRCTGSRSAKVATVLQTLVTDPG